MSRLDFKFEYGRVNHKLHTKVLEWEKHELFGGYVIVGPSGSGKTLLLKELEKELDKTAYVQGYDVLEGLYNNIRKGCVNPKLAIPKDSNCILIDHLDDIAGKVATTDELCRMIKKVEYDKDGNKNLIICTFVDERVAKVFANLMNYEVLYVKHVRPNIRIVRDKEREFEIDLGGDRIRDFAELDTMFELRQAFREIERNDFLKEHARACKETNEYKLILTSRGLNTTFGKNLLKSVFEKEKLVPTSIFLMTLPSYEVDDIIIKHCEELGFTDIYKAGDYEDLDVNDMPDVDYVFVTEGNTFEVAEYMQINRFDVYIRNQVFRNRAIYIGASAGAIIAAKSFREAENFDSNFVGMTKFRGLMLLPHEDGVGDTVIPHYTFKQLQTYIDNMDKIDRSRYSVIYNVANEEALILDCKRTANSSVEKVELIKKRRIRL